MTVRRYDEAEVRELLERALETSGRTLPAAEGLTLDEVKAIGAEVGIDEAALERAARTLDVARPKRGGMLGAPLQGVVHRDAGVASGHRVPTGEVLSVIRREMARAGRVSEVDDVVEWRDSSEMGHRVVTVAEEGGRRTLTGLADLSGAAVVTFVPAGLIGTLFSTIGVVANLDDGDLLAALLFAVFLPILFGVLRSAFRWYSDRELAKLGRTLDALATRLAVPTPSPPEADGSSPTESGTPAAS